MTLWPRPAHHRQPAGAPPPPPHRHSLGPWGGERGLMHDQSGPTADLSCSLLYNEMLRLPTEWLGAWDPSQCSCRLVPVWVVLSGQDIYFLYISPFAALFFKNIVTSQSGLAKVDGFLLFWHVKIQSLVELSLKRDESWTQRPQDNKITVKNSIHARPVNGR